MNNLALTVFVLIFPQVAVGGVLLAGYRGGGSVRGSQAGGMDPGHPKSMLPKSKLGRIL